MRCCDQGPAAFALAAALLLATAPAAAREKCDVPVAEHARVAAVDDGGSFTLNDGRRVRLASLLAPRTGEPFAARAKERLAALIASKSVGLAYAEKGTDRYGDVLAHVFVEDGVWLQQALIAEGLARVHTRADMRRCAPVLLEAENEARLAKRGIWTEPFYRVRKPGELESDIATFQIVEGKVVLVAVRRNRVFVNFGPDYRTDFTVTTSPADRRRLAKQGIDPTTWAGKTVRVRGWLSLLNGPEIELTHPEQIQILE
jgi:endonuclease YncB( thermonuclease family)